MKQKNTTTTILSIDGIRRPLKRRRVPERQSESIRYSFLKIGGVSTLAIMILISLTSIGSTVSYMNDTETSHDNLLRAGQVQITLASLEGEDDVGGEDFTLDVGSGEKSMPLVYSVRGELDGNNEPGCETIVVDAAFDPEYHFLGLVSVLNTISTSTMGSWQFKVTLPEGNPLLGPESVCNGSIVFRAVPNGTASTTAGYSDEKRYTFSIHNIVPIIIPLVVENASTTEEVASTTPTVVEEPSAESVQAEAPPPVQEETQ